MTCAEYEYQWCWLCEEEYKTGHYERGQCNGKQFIEADSVEEANEIRLPLYYDDGNYCCRRCCIEQCAETNWDYDFTCAYITLVSLIVIGIPIAAGLAPLTVPIGVCIGGVSIGKSINKLMMKLKQLGTVLLFTVWIGKYLYWDILHGYWDMRDDGVIGFGNGLSLYQSVFLCVDLYEYLGGQFSR